MRILLTALASRIIEHGHLEIEFADGTIQTFGDGSGQRIAVRFSDRRGPLDLVLNPELALGELFMDGRLEMAEGSIYDFLSLVSANAVRRKPPALMKAIRIARDAKNALLVRNGRRRALANSAHHYDLDGRLYDLFLDDDRQYTCAYFERPDMSLDEAQLAKKRHIAAKLIVEPGHRALDIGCGWGGMALYLARVCGAEVVGVSLSKEQLSVARERAQKGGLAGRISFRLEDYRDTQGVFDRIVSVGMLEAVGPAQLGVYFAKVASLLDSDGVALIHTIGKVDGPGAANPWLTKYIFPGGYVPSMSELAAAIEASGLYLVDVEVLRMHYAETLKAWRERFLARRDEAKALYDERFCRMWEFYLALCEVAFRVDGECVFQVLLAKQHDTVPITRDYIAEREQTLRGP